MAAWLAASVFVQRRCVHLMPAALAIDDFLTASMPHNHLARRNAGLERAAALFALALPTPYASAAVVAIFHRLAVVTGRVGAEYLDSKVLIGAGGVIEVKTIYTTTSGHFASELGDSGLYFIPLHIEGHETHIIILRRPLAGILTPNCLTKDLSCAIGIPTAAPLCLYCF